ncbi:hypothetical protein [Psychrosphaera algicola]|uniref:DUF3955 domain-containing protein n=1 Tax=Psychrosphaera algicola TaxID=3023714 RepID=A0ABT5FC36_9GAMM|nr:hypothetical protein [Psychrosphaera sp. G1-22]MDC2889113.1 hypothetical protein [Psychrosphaera sp. G1-22]
MKQSNKSGSMFHAPKEIRVDKKWLLPVKGALLLFAVYFIQKSYFGYVSGEIFGRRNYSNINDEAFDYWLLVSGCLLIGLLAIWQSFKVKSKIKT